MKSKRLLGLGALFTLLLIFTFWFFWPESTEEDDAFLELVGSEEIDALPSPPPAPSPSAPLPPSMPPAAASDPVPQTINIQAPADLSVAEGSTFYLPSFNIQYQGKGQLAYDWKLLKGPEAKLEWKADLHQGQPRLEILLGDLEEKTDFILSLRASDGLSEAAAQVKITAVPAKIKLVKQVGGRLQDLQPLGKDWVALWGRSLQIYHSDGVLSKSLSLDFLPQALLVPAGIKKPELLLQDTRGAWHWLALGKEGISSQRRIPSLDTKVQSLQGLALRGQAYALARLAEGIELWSFEDPRKPRLKNSLKITLKDQDKVALWEQSLFVAGESEIKVYERSSSRLLASLPAGGSPQDLRVISLGKKSFLALSIGEDRSKQGRQDYGLRLFEIREDGRLGSERRLALSHPVDSWLLLADQSLLFNLKSPQGFLQELYDFKKFTKKKLPQAFKALGPGQKAWRSFASSTSQSIWFRDQTSLTLLAQTKDESDTLQWQSSPSHSSVHYARWVEAEAQDGGLWLAEQEPKQNSLSFLQRKDLSKVQTWTLQGPAQKLLPLGKKNLLLSQGQEAEKSLGSLALLSAQNSPASEQEPSSKTGTPAPEKPALAKEKPKALRRLQWLAGQWGRAQEPAPVRAWDLDFYQDAQKEKLAVALSALPTGEQEEGIAWWEQDRAASLEALLVQDIPSQARLLPLAGARSLAFSADGQALVVAAGLNGLVSWDLGQEQAVSRLNLGADWLATRVSVSPTGALVLASFVNQSNGQVALKIFALAENFKLQEYATLSGLPSWRETQTWQNSNWALTYDDYYLFVPQAGGKLKVYNLSLPTKPFAIAEMDLGQEALSVTLANQFKEVFLALGEHGLLKLDFGF